MELSEEWQGPAKYQIKVKGLLRNQWLSWFEGLSIESEGSFTIITVEVLDQTALHGLIAKVRDMGLPLISIKRFNKDGSEISHLQK